MPQKIRADNTRKTRPICAELICSAAGANTFKVIDSCASSRARCTLPTNLQLGLRTESSNLYRLNSLANELTRELGVILRTSNEPADLRPGRGIASLYSASGSCGVRPSWKMFVPVRMAHSSSMLQTWSEGARRRGSAMAFPVSCRPSPAWHLRRGGSRHRAL